jgi:chemotaxis protein MotA
VDLATIIGLLVAVGAVLGAVTMEGAQLGAFISTPSAILVFGGTLGATIIGFPLSQVLKLPLIAKKAFFSSEVDRAQMINMMVGFAQKARREGIRVLEEDVSRVENAILKMGIQLAVDGTPGEMVREILEIELEMMHERHKQGRLIFSTMGGFGPTLGIIGTVMGLVNMLGNLSDPKSMGPAIAGAFLATLYGVSSANLVFLPIAAKLKLRSEEEILVNQMLLEGILAIQSGDSPRAVEAKMRAFLTPKQKAAARAAEA